MEKYSSDNNTHQGTWEIPYTSSWDKTYLFYVVVDTDTSLFSMELTPNFGNDIGIDSPSISSSLSFWLREENSGDECHYHSRLFLFGPRYGLYDLLTGQKISSTSSVRIGYNIIGGETTSCGFYYREIL